MAPAWGEKCHTSPKGDSIDSWTLYYPEGQIWDRTSRASFRSPGLSPAMVVARRRLVGERYNHRHTLHLEG